MKTKDFVVWFVVLLILAGGYVFIKKSKTAKSVAIPYPTPSVEQRVTVKFGGLEIPNDVDRTDLNSVGGNEGLGIVTRKYSNGHFVLTVLGDLSKPQDGYSYEAWLMGDNKDLIKLGELRIAKGGYLVDFVSTKDYSNYDTVFVTLEKKIDANPEQHILEGSF